MMLDIKPPIKDEMNFEEMLNSKNAFWKKILISFSILIILILISIGFYFYQKKGWKIFNEKKIIINKNSIAENSTENSSKNVAEVEGENNSNLQNLDDLEIVEMEKKFDDPEKSMSISSEEAEKIIKFKAQETILALKNKNFAKVSSFVHPTENLIFSPYCYIKPEYKSFSKAEVKNLFRDYKKYNWGDYNGISPEKIDTTFKEYYENFVYDQDFSKAEKISYNKILGKGNMTNNIQDFFPNSIIVEYHFSGFNPEFEGMDWKSLRLVFIKIGEEWYLKAIVHDTWTI